MQYASVFRPGLFAGRTILVTGGGSGLGRCTAHELKSLGARVALAGRTQEKLDRVKEELGDPDTFTFAADLRREDEVKAMVDGVLGWSDGRIDGLVNNAGGQFPAQLRDISLNGWNAVVNNNMTATFLVSKAVYLGSMDKHGGAIVNVGADFELGNPGMGHNGAARAGQTNFTYTASVEWAHSGVRVNSVLPGFIASSGLDRYPERAHGVLRGVKGRVPLKRHGTESEIAAAIVYLLSDAAAYVTGIALRVDGGLHNAGKSNFYEVPDHDRSTPYNGFPLYRRPKVLE
ncbi:MAG: SDR family oxidoreductase [Reyranella sp.]|jgi:citronellol/citronellal dehydrogenase|uniref:SDR family oxidoreductase n=1 Tax=Reyranella sp. TaxID=1929291 RepID=UPI00096639CC|nr:SDR family oxidoreductase [Reyranella sp.]MBR2817959.1 SDR family oxidoreductase [Reyranella sp.]OJU39188.1 MAG: 2,4-dienoyl-CoA reductase [Alphaproteobacteria bacterium 65-37]